MIRFLLALVAVLAMFAPSAEAHGGGVLVRDAFGNVRFVPTGPTIVTRGGFVVGDFNNGFSSRGFHGQSFNSRGFNNFNQFNQNGGRNRVGFRR